MGVPSAVLTRLTFLHSFAFSVFWPSFPSLRKVSRSLTLDITWSVQELSWVCVCALLHAGINLQSFSNISSKKCQAFMFRLWAQKWEQERLNIYRRRMLFLSKTWGWRQETCVYVLLVFLERTYNLTCYRISAKRVWLFAGQPSNGGHVCQRVDEREVGCWSRVGREHRIDDQGVQTNTRVVGEWSLFRENFL